MLAKLQATNIEQVRQVLGMPSKEADRCVNADDPAAACNAWLADDAAETRDAEGASMNGSEGLQHSAAEDDMTSPGGEGRATQCGVNARARRGTTAARPLAGASVRRARLWYKRRVLFWRQP